MNVRMLFVWVTVSILVLSFSTGWAASGSPDIDENFIVDTIDFSVLADDWQLHSDTNDPNWSASDLTKDGRVDFSDLLVLTDAWLDCLVGPAGSPNPTVGTTGVDPNVTLRWTAGNGALEHDIYLGTDANAVAGADRLSAEFIGTVSDINSDPFMLGYNTNYFWRIDETGPRCTTKGEVWNFKTQATQYGFLAGWYKMDEDAPNTEVLDSSGNGYHGTSVVRNTEDMNAVGKIKGALHFDGWTDYIDTHNSFESVFQDSFSVNLWVSSGVDCSNSYSTSFLGTLPDGSRFCFGLDDSLDLSVWYGNSDCTGCPAPEISGFHLVTEDWCLLEKDKWHMATVVIKKTSETTLNCCIYVDAVEEANQSYNVAMGYYNSDLPVYIGASNRGFPYYLFYGDLDNVMIFNKALNPNEILELYDEGNKTLITSATSGGTVVAPGVGTYTYPRNADVNVVATPDDSHHFVEWTGTAVEAGAVANPSSASTMVTMNGDYTLVANYVPNLVAWYKMNDNVPNKNVVDSMDYANGTSIYRNTSDMHVAGKVDGALRFNGFTPNGDYINTHNGFTSVFQDSFTVNLWVSSGVNCSNSYSTSFLGSFGGSRFCFGLDDSLDLSVWYGNSECTGCPSPYISGFHLVTEDWCLLEKDVFHMATVVMKKTSETTLNCCIYVDGVEEANQSYNVAMGYYHDNGLPLYLGATNMNGSVYWNFYGGLDNIMIFNKALNLGEILDLYEGTRTLTTSTTTGGTVTAPGIGTYTYPYSTEVEITANVTNPDSHYQFVGWTGTAVEADAVANPLLASTTVDMTGDYTLTANFAYIYYVDANASGANNGSSWANAFKYLQDALKVVGAGKQIWVAAGTYEPDCNSAHPNGNTDRNETFKLISNVAIYGGFPLGGGLWEDRNPKEYETILSGDIHGDDGTGFINHQNNSCHVVTASGTSPTAVLDGFTLYGGYGYYGGHCGGGMYNVGGSPTITNCNFSGNQACEGEGDNYNYGGGMYNSDGSPTITNCTFSGNTAYCGGGMYNDNCNAKITNCIFSLNLAKSNGGGMYNKNGSPLITNCTINANLAYYYGGGIYNDSAGSTITNSIIWGNSAYDNPQIGGTFPNVSYSDIQKSVDVWPGTGNINAEPLFVDGPFIGSNTGEPSDYYGDLRLQSGSPCIDAGSNSAVPAGITTDLAGNLRFIDDPATEDTGLGAPPIVDMGAFEYKEQSTQDGVTIYVSTTGDDDNSGLSWPEAKQTLQAALDIAQTNDEIWVVAGTYKPDQGATVTSGDQDATFQLINGVAIYGGFAGGETNRNQRNVFANKTILSGDIGCINENYDNSRHVVTGSGTDETAVLDGFTVAFGGTGGEGGGMYNNDGSPMVTNCIFIDGDGIAMCNKRCSSPIVTNCTFTRNQTDSSGGAMYNENCSSPLITNCAFFGNTSNTDGGAIYNNISSSPTITNCTFSNNLAQKGGGICNMSYSSPIVTSCILWNNLALGEANGPQIYNYPYYDVNTCYPVITFSDIQDGWTSMVWNPDDGNHLGREFNMNFESNPTATSTRAVTKSGLLTGTLKNYKTGPNMWVGGKRGAYGADFGSNDGAQGGCYISFPDRSYFDFGGPTDKHTWTFWFKPSNITYSTEGTFIRHASSSGEDQWWEIRMKNGKLEFCHGLGYLTMETVSSLYSLGVRTYYWSHIAVVLDRETQTASKIYLNGSEVPVTIKAYNSVSSSNIDNNIQFGAGQYEFDGLLDEVRLYNRVLSPSEISILYRDEVPFTTVPEPNTGNINADPCFVGGGNRRLLSNSPCIDAGGDSWGLPRDYADLDGDDNRSEEIPLDLDLSTRVIYKGDPGGDWSYIDMGAYEHNNNVPSYPVFVSGGICHSLFISDSASTAWGCGTNMLASDFNYCFVVVGTGECCEELPCPVLPPRQVVKGNKPCPGDYLEDINGISAGYTHSLTVDSNGFVWAWGTNSYGQIGVGDDGGFGAGKTPKTYWEPMKVKNTGGTGFLSNITRVVASTGSAPSLWPPGPEYSLAIDVDGNVWAWGINTYYACDPAFLGGGQLGIGSHCDIVLDNGSCIAITPHQVLLPEGTIIMDIDAAATHSIACDSTGNVWTWGCNQDGELGDGTSGSYPGVCPPGPGCQDENPHCSLVPVKVVGEGGIGSLGNIVDVAVLGGSHPVDGSVNASYALSSLTSGGNVWAWGCNCAGQLGNGGRNYSATPVKVKGLDGIGHLGNIIAISAGCSIGWGEAGHVLALDKDGYVWAWGSNVYGQLGNPDSSGTTPVKVKKYDGGDLSNIVAIEAGGGYSMAVDKDGNIWVWGSNSSYQLGIPGTYNRTTAVMLEL